MLSNHPSTRAAFALYLPRPLPPLRDQLPPWGDLVPVYTGLALAPVFLVGGSPPVAVADFAVMVAFARVAEAIPWVSLRLPAE